MSEDAGTAPAGWRGMLDPMSRAVSGLVLAVVGLTGPNILATGVQLLAEGQFGGAPSTFMLWLAVASAALLGLALWLALQPARLGDGWVSSMARSAVIVATVGLGGCLLLVVGALTYS
jgi:hypothetical protein